MKTVQRYRDFTTWTIPKNWYFHTMMMVVWYISRLIFMYCKLLQSYDNLL